jgi:hypothetical protein
MDKDFSNLPWNFEAFRRYINYSTLQNTASVLCLFDGRDILSSPKDLSEFEEMMSLRTGLDWSPERLVSEDIQFNTEGNLFRNKARVLTSFYLIDPIAFKNGEVKPTEFCRALAAGFISKELFYKEIFQRFQYPHPAYDENWTAWKSAGIVLRPLLFILDILINLARINPEQAYLTVSEFAEFGHPHPFQDKAQEIAGKIIEFRRSDKTIQRQRSDKVERKIGDIFGFMCMSQFCYYDKNSIRLNLMGINPEENVYFYQKRGEYDTLNSTNDFLIQSLERI